jgi:O-antigen polymerase
MAPSLTCQPQHGRAPISIFNNLESFCEEDKGLYLRGDLAHIWPWRYPASERHFILEKCKLVGDLLASPALNFHLKMTSKKLFFLVSALYWLVGMHVFIHNAGGHGLYLPVNAMGWIYISVVIGLGLWTITEQERLSFSPFQTGLWAGAFLLFVPLLYPGFGLKEHAAPRLLGLLAGLLFLFSLHQWQLSRQTRDQLLHGVLGAVAMEAVFGLVQFYLLNADNPIGYDTKFNRPYGIFQQTNVMASFMATGLALAIWLETRSEGRSWLTWLRCGVILAASLLLVVIQSRVGQLGGLLALVLLVPQVRQHKKLLRVLLLVALGVGLGLASMAKVEAVVRGVEVYQSVGVRPTYWAFAAKLVAASPWTGWGYGGFEATFINEYADARMVNRAMPRLEPNLSHPHNEFLLWAVEGGLVAMLGLLLIAGTVVWRLTRTHWVQGTALLALLSPILLHTQTEYPFYHSVTLWLVMLVLLHVVDAEVHESQQAQGKAAWCAADHRPKLLMRVVALLIPMLVVPFMATAVHTSWLVTQFERSKGSQVSLLMQIINPMAWTSRIEGHAYTLRLKQALQTGNPDELRAYVAWGQDFVKHSPRTRIYFSMVLALQMLGEKEKMMNVMHEALRLYPEDQGLIDLMVRIISAKPS